jgi:hypothetical protein
MAFPPSVENAAALGSVLAAYREIVVMTRSPIANSFANDTSNRSWLSAIQNMAVGLVFFAGWSNALCRGCTNSDAFAHVTTVAPTSTKPSCPLVAL